MSVPETRRPPIVFATGGLAVLLAACGGSGSTTPTATPSPQASASTSSSGGAPGDFVLTSGELPSGSETWQQIADQTLNGNANTDQRAWQNPDNTQRIEIDVFLDSSTTAAESDYAQWQSTIKQKAATVSSTPDCPAVESGAGACNEVVGATSDSKSQDLMTWQQGKVLVAVFLVNANGTADQSYFEMVCQAEFQAISGLVGS